MIGERVILELICDSCLRQPYSDEEGETVTYDVRDRVRLQALDIGGYAVGDWTTDGEGKHHCGDCERLELTDEARADLLRRTEATGPALFEMNEPNVT